MELIVQELSKSYERHSVFKNLCLSFSQGVSYLISPNGSGKSTLLKLIAGIESKDKGKVLFNGKADKFSSYGSYVPDKMTMYPFITGQEFLELICRAKSVLKAENTLLKELNITQYLNLPFEEMSLGTQKKFFITAGLMGSFSCLLMDEPSNAIDKKSLEIIIQYLKRLSDDKLLLIATHDEYLQAQLPGRVFSLQ